MNIDDFINKAIGQVRDAKKTGKKGRTARKEIRKGEAKLAAVKLLIKETARACAANAWKDRRLVVRRYVSTCSGCGTAQSCDSIYLEQHHKKAGMMLRRLDEVQLYSFPDIPRELEIHEAPQHICGGCFLHYVPEPIQPGYSEPHPRDFESLTKWQEEYAIFSANYDRRESWAWFQTQFPPTLLLEHLV